MNDDHDPHPGTRDAAPPAGRCASGAAGGSALASPSAAVAPAFVPETVPVVPVAVALSALAPLRADPVALAEAVARYVTHVLPDRAEDALARWRTVSAAVGAGALGSNGQVVRAVHWRREAAGRWHASSPALQAIPNAIRGAFRPPAGMVYIDADYTSAHLHIAAARAQDDRLRRVLEAGSIYDHWASVATVLVKATCPSWSDGITQDRMRSAVKRAILALINGGTIKTIATALSDGALRPAAPGRRYERERHVDDWSDQQDGEEDVRVWAGTPSERDAQRPAGRERRKVRFVGPRVKDAEGAAGLLLRMFNSDYPELALFLDRVKVATATARPVIVQSLTGRSYTVDNGSQGGAEGGQYRRALSAHWSCVEAEAMDMVLERIHCTIGPLGGAPVLPLFDGLLVEVPCDQAAGACLRVRELMGWAAGQAGVPAMQVKIVVQATWSKANT